jgi:hypothetical protein
MGGEWLPVGDLPKLEPSQIPESPPALARAWGGANLHEVLALSMAETFFPGSVDPAMALIEEIENPEKREALKIAYNWSLDRKQSVGQVSKQDFLNRAKNERRCEYLKLNRNDLWGDLEALIEQ